MRSRYKTFKQFFEGIRIAYDSDGGCTIICKLKNFVILKTVSKPWNSKETKIRFLIRLYFEQVLEKINLSKKIQRIEGYELLGKRCYEGDYLYIICDCWDSTDVDTGETIKKIKAFNKYNYLPTEFFINQVQL